MKKRLLGVAGGIFLVATAGRIITIPAVAQTIRAAFVKNIDEKGRNPWSQPLRCSNTSSCVIGLPPVPEGMRLVVETINLFVVAADSSVDVTFGTNQDNGVSHIFSPALGHTDASGVNRFYLNASVNEFVDASVTGPYGIQPPYVTVNAGDGTPAGTIYLVTGRITGYMVNLNN